MNTAIRFGTLAVALVALTSGGMAGEDGPARAIVEKALKATGGAEKLAQHRAGTWEGRGIFHGFGGVKFTFEGARQGEDQVAIKTVSVSPDGMFTRVLVVNRDRGWLVINGQLQELTKKALGEEKERLYGNWVATLLPLADHKFRLKHIGENKVGDRAVVGVEIDRDGHRTIRLFFDKETGLLAKKETRGRSPQHLDKEVIEEVIFSDYQPVDGVKHATKVKLLVDGKLTSEMEITTNRSAKELDDKYFARPEPKK